MPAAHRQTDTGSGHACHFSPTKAMGGSPDVYVNDKPLMLMGCQKLFDLIEHRSRGFHGDA